VQSDTSKIPAHYTTHISVDIHE